MAHRSLTRFTSEKSGAKPPVRLHLELGSNYFEAKDRKILKKYGGSSSGQSITRDILVPADMPLHALHYAIQRLYGWQNSHLRAFRLPDDVFSTLTGDTVRGWFQLVGILFQYSTDEQDLFWDDNYESGSIKIWLKRKYTGSYKYLGQAEHYASAQQEIQALIDRIPVIEVLAPFDFSADYTSQTKIHKPGHYKPDVLRVAPLIDMTLPELTSSITLETSPNTLQERLLITDLLAPRGQQPASRADLFEHIKSLVAAGTRQNEELPIGRSVAPFTPDPPILPITDKLTYAYDFGDGWEIEVTRLSDCADLLKAGRLTPEELAEAEQTVISKHRPVCLAIDGINVVDDVGGLGGFVDFLKTIHEGKDIIERQEMLGWARSMGWNMKPAAMKDVL